MESPGSISDEDRAPTPGPGPLLSPRASIALVFVTSAAVLVLEILSLRLVAPYVGITLETNTAVIGFALAAIAAGAWLGGKAADATPPENTIGPVTLGGGVLVLFVPPAVRWTGEAVEGADPSAVLLVVGVAVFVPAALLSAVTPMVVKLQLSTLDETGSVVGRLSGIGTVGALAGTFVTGFLLVAAAPSTWILLALGVVLVLIGAVLIARRRGARTAAARSAVALVGVAATLLAPQPCDVETAYHCADVVVDDARPTGRTLYLDTLSHSYVDLSDPTYLEFSYIRGIASVLDATHPAPEPVSALHLGGGGFTMPRYLDATRPGSRSRVYEVDAEVVELNVDRLGLELGEGIDAEVGDARVGLNEEGTATRDIVIGDAFGGVAVPWHLTTRQTVAEVRRVLRAGGVYAVNVIDYPPLGFARAEVATIAEVFDHVAVVTRPDVPTGDGGGNVVIVAADEPLPVAEIADHLAERAPELVVVHGADVADFAGDAQVLTDDFAPVDQLLTPVTATR